MRVFIILFFTAFMCASFAAVMFFTATPAFACGFNSNGDFICPGTPAQLPAAPAPNRRRVDPSSPVYSGGGVVIPPPAGTPPPPTQPPVACTGGDPYQQFLEHLKLREGVRNCAYRDSLGYPTIGVGHLIRPQDNLQLGDCISDAQVDNFLRQDAQGAWNAAQQQAAATPCRNDGCWIAALGSVNFQLGTGWRQKFPNTWSLIAAGRYGEAANALNGTLWARQTPVRVRDFQEALRRLENGGCAG